MAKQKDRTEAVLTALGHPLRQRILKLLNGGKKASSPKQMSVKLDEPLTNVSYHVRVLADCEALKLVRTRAVRGSKEHFYKPSREFMADPGVVALLKLAA